MGFLKKLFGNSKTISSILLNTQNNIFRIYGVNSPTDAQKMNISVYLCISGVAILNSLDADKLQHVMDNLIEDTKILTKPLKMRISDLSNTADELKLILAEFPNGSQVTESTIVNGLAAFEAIYFSMGEDIVNKLLSQGDHLMVAAATIVSYEIFGKEQKIENILEVSTEILNFGKELVATQ